MRSHPYGFLLKALTEGANEIREQLVAVPRAAARWRPPDGDRSIAEIAAHLRDAEAAYQEQIRRITEEPEPNLRPADLDAAPQGDAAGVNVRTAAGAYARLRHITMYLLWDLLPGDWERTGTHPYRGPVSIAQLVREMNQHDLEHLWEIRRTLDRWSERNDREEEPDA